MDPDVSQFILRHTGLNTGVQLDILRSITVAVVVGMLHSAVNLMLSRGVRDPQTLFRAHKLSNYFFFLLGLFLIGGIWFSDIHSVATVLGLASAGIAIALKDPLLNMAAWVYILWRKPFVIGDRIQIGDDRGDVVDINPAMTTLIEIGRWVHADQSTGRLVFVPNGKVFTESVANYTQSFPYIWNEIPVMVTFESDWESAVEMLERIARRHSVLVRGEDEEFIRDNARHMLLYFTGMEPAVYVRVESDGVLLTMRYLCEPKRRRNTENVIWRDILHEFRTHPEVDFALQTHRLQFDVTDDGEPESGLEAEHRRKVSQAAADDLEDLF